VSFIDTFLTHSWHIPTGKRITWPQAIQTILRREGYPKPYEALKELTRGGAITKQTMHSFVDGLDEKHVPNLCCRFGSRALACPLSFTPDLFRRRHRLEVVCRLLVARRLPMAHRSCEVALFSAAQILCGASGVCGVRWGAERTTADSKLSWLLSERDTCLPVSAGVYRLVSAAVKVELKAISPASFIGMRM
jgi:hypothetical protein